MGASIRHCLSPIAGIATLGIGLGFVALVQVFAPPFTGASAVAKSRVFDEPLTVRPGDNTDPFAPLKTELSCYDPQILPIWHELKRDNSFQEGLRFADGNADCSEMLEVRKLDLNRDGEDEFLVRGKGHITCGPIGNCGYWIFESRNKGVNKLLSAVHEADAHEFAVDEVQKVLSHSYPEILLASRDGQNVLHFQTYRFNGIEYVPSRCMSEVPKLLREGAGSWNLITCHEFYRRRDESRKTLERLAK